MAGFVRKLLGRWTIQALEALLSRSVMRLIWKEIVNLLYCAIHFEPLPTDADSQWTSLFRGLIHLLILSRWLNTKRATRYFECQMAHFFYTCHQATEPPMTTG